MKGAFLDARIEVTKTLIVNVETALTQLALENVFSYTIDTGQTRQTVTKTDVPRLNDMLGSLYNRLAGLEQRKSGCATTVVGPSW